MSPNAGGGGCGAANENSCAHHVTWSPNKLWRSNSIFNLLSYSMILVLLIELDMSAGPPLATRGLQVPVHNTSA
jgi:hypothetical protein